MTILIAHKRSKPNNLRKKHSEDIEIMDVTSMADEPWVHFSPFWPHGNIPVPFSDGVVATCVEGIWQALKVFETEDVDDSKLHVTNMKGLKRTIRRFGSVRGHRKGIHGKELLPYREARELIYLPVYKWMLAHCVQDELQQLRGIASQNTVVLLDYTTNGDLDNLRTPLSHAALVKQYLDDDWPV
ncbi:hypothetical protein LOC67_20215 [Stieleria sp. JC731]|uniref:DUF6939 family protein n=1 Tax=Pirellulaceae TaxID=2691357 RepID=UPI001E2C3440|nr:hypothetical protein [Stieleria sp. JC731]MCC9602881.1 hypothetical protein [Stieleria sp. JC731]